MDDQEQTPITLRWLAVTGEDVGNGLLAAAFLSTEQLDAAKTKALANLGIKRQAHENHLMAWMRVMHEENGLAPERPAHPRIANAVLQSEASRFMWWLA